MDRMRMAGREKVHYEHATKNPWISIGLCKWSRISRKIMQNLKKKK